MNKKLALSVLAFSLVLSVATTATAAQYTLKVAHEAAGQTNPVQLAWLEFKKEVETKSGGRVEIQIFPGGQLGTDVQLVELTQDGAVDITCPTVSKLAAWDKAFSAPEIPYIFPNREIAIKVLQGDYGKFLDKRLEPMGLKRLGWFENGFRHTTNNVGPIAKPEDFKGIKLRTMQVDAHVLAFKHLGANPTPMAFSELYSALQQKVIDGQENPLANIALARMYEVQKYLSLTNHVYSSYIALINAKRHNALPEDIRKIVATAMDNALAFQLDHIVKEEAKYLETIKKAGVQVNTLSPEQTQAFQKKLSEIEGKMADMVGAEAFKVLKASVAAASKP